MVVRRIKIGKCHGVLIALRAAVIESVALDLSCTPVSITYALQVNDALVLHISAFTHPSFIGLQGRLRASLEMTIRAPDVSQSPVTSHLRLLIPSH